MKKFSLIVILSIVIDRILKIIVSCFLTNKPVYVINNFFYLISTKNDGAAFSLLEGKRLLFIILAIFALVFIVYYVKKTRTKNIGYAMLFGGIVGNLIDRIFFGYVIDYLGFILFGNYMPIFNFADMLIVIGAFITVIGSDKNEDKS